MALIHKCERCGRRVISRLDLSEIRRPDGRTEQVCETCRSTSRCEVCGLVGRDRSKFGVRKSGGAWRVLCLKCLGAADAPPRPGSGRSGLPGRS